MFRGWKPSILFALLLVTVYNSNFFFSEDLLIILASILWLDAAGGLFISSLKENLSDSQVSLKAYFLDIMLQKHSQLNLICEHHLKRILLVNELTLLFSVYSKVLFSIVFNNLIICRTLVSVSQKSIILFTKLKGILNYYLNLTSLFTV